MTSERIFNMAFAKVYSLYVQKAQRKNRSQAEVDQIVCWQTGYDAAGLEKQLCNEVSFQQFFADAPAFQLKAALFTGVVCGVRVGEVVGPLMQKNPLSRQAN